MLLLCTLGAHLESLRARAILGPTWNSLGLSWAVLRPTKNHLALFLGRRRARNAHQVIDICAVFCSQILSVGTLSLQHGADTHLTHGPWQPQGRLGALLGTAWGSFGLTWEPPWSHLGSCGPSRGSIRARLGRLGIHLESSWAFLGHLWDPLGIILGSLGPS